MPGSYAEKVKREKRKKAKKDEKTERMFLYKKKGEKETQKEASGFLKWKKFHIETGSQKKAGKGSKWVPEVEEI